MATQCLYGNISRSEASPGQAKSFLMIFGTVAEWYCWMPFPLCLPLSALSRRRCRAEDGHPLSELFVFFDPPLSLLVVSPGGSRPSPSFPGPSSGLWPLGVGYPWLPCTSIDTFGFSLCIGIKRRRFGPGIFLVSLECYCADVVSILSPPPWQPNVYMAIYHGQRPAPDRQNHF